MATYILRVWLPDRPGSLGALTSKLGEAGGNLAEIQILERFGDRAIDELTVELKDDTPIQWLMQEIDGVAGIVVEDARRIDGGASQRILDPIEIAAKIVAESSASGVISELTTWVTASFTAQWVVAVHLDPPEILSSFGTAPEITWLMSFIAETDSVGKVPDSDGASDTVWASLDAAGIGLIVGRPGRAFRSRERRHLAALATIAALHWMDYSWTQ